MSKTLIATLSLGAIAFGVGIPLAIDWLERRSLRKAEEKHRPVAVAARRYSHEIVWLLEKACRQCAAKRSGTRSEEVAHHFPPSPLVFLQRLAPVYGYSVDDKGAIVDGEGRPIEVSALDEFVRESGVAIREFNGFLCIGGTAEDPKVVFVSHGGAIVAEAAMERKDGVNAEKQEQDGGAE